MSTIPVWDATVFSKNRAYLLDGDVATAFLVRVRTLAEEHVPLSDEHFTVDGNRSQLSRCPPAPASYHLCMRGLCLLAAGPWSELSEQFSLLVGRVAFRVLGTAYPDAVWPTIVGVCVVALAVRLIFGKRLRDRKRRLNQHEYQRLDGVRDDIRKAREDLESTEWLLMQMPHASVDAIRQGIVGLADCADTLRSALDRIPAAIDPLPYLPSSGPPAFPELRTRVESWQRQASRAAALAVAATGADNPLSAMRRTQAGYAEACEVLEDIALEIGATRVRGQ